MGEIEQARQKGGPGAQGGAAEAEKPSSCGTPEYRRRAEAATSAWIALHEAHPVDAEALALAFLVETETGGPDLAGLTFSAADARLWAEAAALHEVAAFTVAGIERLRGTPLANNAKKRLMVDCWRSIGDVGRSAFLARYARDWRAR